MVYIGVIAACSDSATKVSYTLIATLSPLRKNVFGSPLLNQIVSARQINTYQFCVESKMNITSMIKSYTDPCTCPLSYADHQVVISHNDPLTQNSKSGMAWRMQGGDSSTVAISGPDTYTKPGPYYMNVYANCESDADCGYSRCSCAPCSNLPSSPYTMYIGPTADFSNGKSAKAELDSCISNDVLSGLAGQCFEVCPAGTRMVYLYNVNFLPTGIQAAISFGCMAFLLLALGCYWRYNFQTYMCCCPLVSNTCRTSHCYATQ